MSWYNMIWYAKVQYDKIPTILNNIKWYDMIHYNLVQCEGDMNRYYGGEIAQR